MTSPPAARIYTLAMEYLAPPERRVADGFVLRSYEPGDGAALADAVNSSYAHLRRFLPWAVRHTPVEDAEQRVRSFRAQWLLAQDFVIAAFSSDGATLLGGSGYHLREGGLATRNAEIGMWVRADAARCGLGTRMLLELLEWGFGAWPWERLTWRCDPQNTASVRVAEKAGLVLEGTLRSHVLDARGRRRDTLCYAALRGSWSHPRERGSRDEGS